MSVGDRGKAERRNEQRRTPVAGRRQVDVARVNRPARSKIVELDRLADIAADARQRGAKVVLAHGVFDLVHLGHIRHLEAARRHGDLLLVTLTADAFVNKGPGRPAFAEYMRAEVLAALEYVDWVAINPAADAIDLIRRLQPDVYVKGSDYADADEDLTGKIGAERSAVEAHGGRLVFTDEVTSSSTKLINRYLNLLDPELRDYLERLRQQVTFEQIQEMIERVRNYRVLVVGDTIVDEYQYVVPLGKSAKENMIATLFKNQELFAGGVLAAANHVAHYCAEVTVVTCVGTDDSQEELLYRSRLPNVELRLLERPNAPTTRKCRFIDPAYMRKLFEVYSMDDTPLGPELERQLNELIGGTIADYDVVLVTDFGHGLLGRSTIEKLTREAEFLAVNAQTNSANAGFNLITKYPRADYVCLDAPEARLAIGDKFIEIEDIAAKQLPSMIDCDQIVLTNGKFGCVARSVAEGVQRIPAMTRTIVDTVGAGDAFFAVTAPLVRAGCPMGIIGFIGNVVGGLKVGIVGHRSAVDKASVLKSVKALLA